MNKNHFLPKMNLKSIEENTGKGRKNAISFSVSLKNYKEKTEYDYEILRTTWGKLNKKE